MTIAPEFSFPIEVAALPPSGRTYEIKADAELLQSGGDSIVEGFAPEMMRLRPVRIAAFGLDPSGSSGLGPRAVTTRKVER